MSMNPLQSRLAASLIASILVLLLYLWLFAPHLASAAELASQRLPIFLDDDNIASQPSESLYNLQFFERASSADVVALTNNVKNTLNLDPGSIQCYRINKKDFLSDQNSKRTRDISSDDEGNEESAMSDFDGPETDTNRRRAASQSLFLSANTCLQPLMTGNGSHPEPPQLVFFHLDSTKSGCPATIHDVPASQRIEFTEGAMTYEMNISDNDLMVGLSAPSLSSKHSNTYNYEIAVSTTEYYHQYIDAQDHQLLWMDSDSNTALLVTKNLTVNHEDTDAIMSQKPPFELFVVNNASMAFNGVSHSACGLRNYAQISSTSDDSNPDQTLTSTLTTRGPGSLPKQQFYFEGLNSSSTYSGILVRTRNTTSKANRTLIAVGGGGLVFRATDFSTTPKTNCKLVTDLDFCDATQYAVPGNDKFNNTKLAMMYDDFAKIMYTNFEKVMMQIPCEADPESAYSLARNCDQCRAAYKKWLCTVAIPRCEDFTSDNHYTMPRNVGQAYPNGTRVSQEVFSEIGQNPYNNASRNTFIDDEIRPGPYREILPCDDICYEVVQNCPASIGFACPRPKSHGFAYSYGRRGKDDAIVYCNYPGEARTPISDAKMHRLTPEMLTISITTALVLLL